MERVAAGRALSRSLVFGEIRKRGVTSRAHIVRTTGLSKATVSEVVAELVGLGLTREVGSENASLGRPRVILELVPEARLALGAEFSDDECRVVLIDLLARPVARVIRPVTDMSVNGMLGLLQECVTEVTRGVDASRILGIGVGVPAHVHPPSGTVIRSVVIKWENVPLAQELLRRFPWPRVIVVARGHAAAWGEWWYGVGRNVSDLVYIRIGSGIGTGLVLSGALYMGQGFGAGDLGHVAVQPDGILCRCGNRGCLETLASSRAILERARQLLRSAPENPLWDRVQGSLDRITLRILIEAADTGNPAALEAFAESGRWLGLAISYLVNVLSPGMIIIGGPVAEAGEAILGPLRVELSKRSLPANLAQTKVVPSALQADAPAIGAASLILHELTAPSTLSSTWSLSSRGPSIFPGG